MPREHRVQMRAENTHWSAYGMRYMMFLLLIYLLLEDGTRAKREPPLTSPPDQGWSQGAVQNNEAAAALQEKFTTLERAATEELARGSSSAAAQGATLQWLQFMKAIPTHVDTTARYTALGHVLQTAASNIADESITDDEKLCCPQVGTEPGSHCVVSHRLASALRLPSSTSCSNNFTAMGGGWWSNPLTLFQAALNIMPSSVSVSTAPSAATAATYSLPESRDPLSGLGTLGEPVGLPRVVVGGIGVSGVSNLFPSGLSGMWYRTSSPPQRDDGVDGSTAFARLDALVHKAVIGLWNVSANAVATPNQPATSNNNTAVLHELMSLSALREALLAVQEMKLVLIPHLLATSASGGLPHGGPLTHAPYSTATTGMAYQQQPLAGSIFIKGASVVSGALSTGTVFGDGHGIWDWWPLTLLWDSSSSTPLTPLSQANGNLSAASAASFVPLPDAAAAGAAPHHYIGDVVLESLARDGATLQSPLASTKWRGLQVGSGLASSGGNATKFKTQWVIVGFPQGKSTREKLFSFVANSTGVRRDRRAPATVRSLDGVGNTTAYESPFTSAEYHGPGIVLNNIAGETNAHRQSTATPAATNVAQTWSQWLPRYAVNQPTFGSTGQVAQGVAEVVSAAEVSLSDHFKKVVDVVYDARIDAEDAMAGIPPVSTGSQPNTSKLHVNHRLENLLDVFVRSTLFSYFQLLATANPNASLLKRPILGADISLPSTAPIPFFNQPPETAAMRFTVDGTLVASADSMFARPCIWLGNIVSPDAPQEVSSGLFSGILLSSCGDQLRLVTSSASFDAFIDVAWSSQCTLVALELLLTCGIVSMRWVRNSRARQLRISVGQLITMISMQFVLNTILEVMGLLAAPTVRLTKLLWLITMINSNLTAFLLFEVYRGHMDQDNANYQAARGQLQQDELRRRFFVSQGKLFGMFMLAILVPQILGLVLQSRIASPWVILLIGLTWWLPQLVYLLRGKAGVRESAGKGFTVTFILAYGAFGIVVMRMFIVSPPSGLSDIDGSWQRHFHTLSTGLVLPSSASAVLACHIAVLSIALQTVTLLALRIFNIPLLLPGWLTGSTRHVYDVQQLATVAHLEQLNASRRGGFFARMAKKLEDAIERRKREGGLAPGTEEEGLSVGTSPTAPPAGTTSVDPLLVLMELLNRILSRILSGRPAPAGSLANAPVAMDPREVMRRLSEGALDEQECTICTVPLTEELEEDEGMGGSARDNTSNCTHDVRERDGAAAVDMEGPADSGGADSRNVQRLPPLWVTPCGHFFHKQCLLMWMEEKLTCPLCRLPLPEP